jgi:transposase-like protein
MDMVTKKPDVAPTEVTPKAKRRTYSPAFKRKILAEADAAAAEPGQLAALLRRHGLCSSHLTEWRRAREAGALVEAAPVRRGPTPAPKDAERVRELIADVNPVLPGWGGCFRTGNAATKFNQIDRYVAGRLHRFLVKRQGRNLRAGQADRWTQDFFVAQGLHRLRGTVRYPTPRVLELGRPPVGRVREIRTHGLKGSSALSPGSTTS